MVRGGAARAGEAGGVFEGAEGRGVMLVEVVVLVRCDDVARFVRCGGKQVGGERYGPGVMQVLLAWVVCGAEVWDGERWVVREVVRPRKLLA